MAKNKNGQSRLTAGVKAPKLPGLSASKSLSAENVSSSSSSKAGASKPPSLGGMRTLSMSGKDTPTRIQFGRPSNSKTPTTQTTSAWGGLLKQSASGGLAGGLSGGLSSIAGIGGLFSSIASLFGGGKSAPPPLVDFQLPNSMSQTVYVSSKGSTSYQGTAVEKPNTSGTPGSQAASAQPLQYQSAAIAQAVKTALLNSSSLNDVIAEI